MSAYGEPQRSSETKSCRRQFLSSCGALAYGAVGALLSSCTRSARDAFIEEKMSRDHIPGVAACIVEDDRVVWANGYGWANLSKREPMSIDSIQNIGSVSKTVTATALMQLWERGKLRLDDDVGAYLSFAIRNPTRPHVPITFKQLLTHTSSIKDGAAYGAAYACGDSPVALGTWLEQYLAPGGEYFAPEENFHPWSPGSAWSYSNVAYGLLGHLVESIAGAPFPAYCKEFIFDPLEMKETSWLLSDIDLSKHAIPYGFTSGGVVRGPDWTEPVVRENPSVAPPIQRGEYEPNCFYNHPNYPDGFLRTSVRQLSRFLRAYLNLGLCDDRRILQERTIREMLRPHRMENERVQGLTWYGYHRQRESVTWEHSGGDPGINTNIKFRLSDGIGSIAFTNTYGIDPGAITTRLLAEAEVA